jgi:hypothetical protein
MNNRDFWNDFEAGVARAERDLPSLATDPMLLARIIASRERQGLDNAGKLAAYLARVSEVLRHDPASSKARAMSGTRIDFALASALAAETLPARAPGSLGRHILSVKRGDVRW